MKLVNTYARGKAIMTASDTMISRFGHKPTMIKFVQSVVETLEEKQADGRVEWSSLFDLASNGASAGFSGYIYYRETVAVFDEYNDAIFDIAFAYCEDNGGKPSEVLGGDAATVSQFKNNAVWFAVEAVCHALTQEVEENKEVANL
jgi:hypothetical protein